MANPTGKGGFQDHPELINKNGAPRKGQTWQESVKRLTDMTRDELIAYVGKSTKLGKLLKELPPNVPTKDALILISIIQFGRDPNPRMLQALMDREEGKPQQPIDMTTNGKELTDIGVRFIDYRTGITPPEDGPGADHSTPSQDKSPGDG